jgi:hypothetical protein
MVQCQQKGSLREKSAADMAEFGLANLAADRYLHKPQLDTLEKWKDRYRWLVGSDNIRGQEPIVPLLSFSERWR